MAVESLSPSGLSASNARLTFREQIEAFKGKLLMPSESYRDLDAWAHERAFVVAGATKAGLLADFHRAVEAAIEKGETLEDFRSRFDDTVAHFGWEYNGTRDWRTRTLYTTNLTTSYAQGRYTQLQQAAGDGLLWMYKHSDISAQPRAAHLALDGLVVSPESPWWRTHYPPWVGGKMNYGCRCYVVAVHPADVAKRGGRYAKPAELKAMGQGTGYLPGDGKNSDLWQLIADKRLKLAPSLGEAFGKDAEAILKARFPDLPAAKLPELPATPKVAPATPDVAIPAHVAEGDNERMDLESFARASASVADRKMETVIGAVSNVDRILKDTGFDLSGYSHMLDNYGVRHTIKKHGNELVEERRGQIAVTLADFSLIPTITDDPDTVFADGKNKIGRDVIVFAKVVNGIGYRYVAEVRAKGKLVATDSLRKKIGAWGS